MPFDRWWDASGSVQGAPGVRRLDVDPQDWLSVAGAAAARGGLLLALWAAPSMDRAAGQGEPRIRAALQVDGRTLVMETTCSAAGPGYRSLTELFPAALRMQRAVRDMSGLHNEDADRRPWLRHAAWPAGWHPLAARSTPEPRAGSIDDYAFIRVEGAGVHEIAVGPVHAGTIEPGHFRFSVVGEKVLRLEERLGYAHKGIEARFAQLNLLEGHRLAARVSGDAAAAYSWAYCQAAESLLGVAPPERAIWLRALCLELERVQNHLGDLGALGNDAGFAFGLVQFSLLKEQLLRAQSGATGWRYAMDAVVPGGVAFDLAMQPAADLAACCNRIADAAQTLRQIYEEHAGVRDRFAGTGLVPTSLARRLGLVGLAARASGIARDLRCDQPCEPYERLEPRRCVQVEGDVAARVAVRFDELQESLRLVRRILSELPNGAVRVAVPTRCTASGTAGFAVGLQESWRGPVLVAVDAAADGQILRCHAHDPSWQNWPVLEHAVIGNIVPDFPLINKSFNLSYSGHDL